MARPVKRHGLVMIYPEPEKGGRGKRSQIQEGFDEPRKTVQNRLSQARAVLHHSLARAQEVLADRTPLDAALKIVEAACYHRRVPMGTSDLLPTLTASGIPTAITQCVLTGIAPALAAVERSGTKLDSDLMWVLIAVQADRLRRDGE